VIVYGHPSRAASADDEIAALRARVGCALADLEDDRLHPGTLRGLLVTAGEIEQMVGDAPAVAGAGREGREAAHAIRAATRCAAEAFRDEWRLAAGERRAAARAALARMLQALQAASVRAVRATVQIPEGFAFYALYPEHYLAAAARWASAHAGATRRDVLVVGVRSIGTTLSAVVGAMLEAHGWYVRRMTVRPTGHPWARRLPFAELPGATWGLVVDEGPGLSGSSMSAVAAAMERAGVVRVEFFPGHDRGPGHAASPAVRARWAATSSWCVPTSELRFSGRSLADALWHDALTNAGAEGRTHAPLLEPLACVDDLGAGAWRAWRFAGADEWPALCRPLERPQLLCTGASGRRVLFAFAGFAGAPGGHGTLADARAERQHALAALGFAAPPLGAAHGWVAHAWDEGHAPHAAEATAALLHRIGAYVARGAGPWLDASDVMASREALERMVEVNVREALGDEPAAAALAQVRASTARPGAGAGDGRLAPHDWIRTGDALIKGEAGGDAIDHTWRGRQPVVWDLAGAMLEWDRDGARHGDLLAGFAGAGGVVPDLATLEAYTVAYAAHRLGQATLFADAESDPDERARLAHDRDRWRETLARRIAARVPEPAR
jgi:hypothetical protein